MEGYQDVLTGMRRMIRCLKHLWSLCDVAIGSNAATPTGARSTRSPKPTKYNSNNKGSAEGPVDQLVLSTSAPLQTSRAVAFQLNEPQDLLLPHCHQPRLPDDLLYPWLVPFSQVRDCECRRDRGGDCDHGRPRPHWNRPMNSHRIVASF